MSFEQIKELANLVSEKRLSGLEVERSGFRLSIQGAAQTSAIAVAGPVDLEPHLAVAAPDGPVAATAPHAAEPEPDGHVLSSPIVGTFYVAPSPDADPFVRVGERVAKGQVVCIVEAMKLMNEIESDVDGVIQQTFPKNAQAVEFGEPLFLIEADE